MIDMDAAAQAAEYLETALSSYRGSAADWESAAEYIFSTPHADRNGLVLHSMIPLPTAFVAQSSNFQYRSFMGLFPDIGRAWLTADTRLYLWSYGEDRILQGAPSAEDFYAYDGFDQIIVSVGLVSPRPAVFIDDVEYLLAVATPVEVTLLGITFSGNGRLGEISLIPTNISVATDGITMLKIDSTADGRIFMAGSDGNLHEFVYYGEPSGWARALLGQRAMKRPRKLVHKSTSLINYVIPSAVKNYFSKTDELVDLAIDCGRNSLYTLSSAGTLSVYDISNPETARFVRSIDVASQSRSVPNLLPSADREFIAIFSVPRHMSNAVHLVVITCLGERIYFSSNMSTSRVGSAEASSSSAWHQDGRPAGGSHFGAHSIHDDFSSNTAQVGSKRQTSWSDGAKFHLESRASWGAPTGLRCIRYRDFPVRSDAVSSGKPCFHMAYWASGAVLMSDLRENDHDHLYAVFPHCSGSSGQHGHAAAYGFEDQHANQSRSYGLGLSSSLSENGKSRLAEAVHEVSLGVGARDSAGYGIYSALKTRPRPVHNSEDTPASQASQLQTRTVPVSRQYTRTFAIAEARTTVGQRTTTSTQGPNGFKDDRKGCCVSSSSMLSALETPSMFWVLTSTAMLLYARVSPKEQLASMIGNSTSTERDTESFFAYYGVAEACAVCVDLATSDPVHAPAVSRILYTHGGHYNYRTDNAQTSQGQSTADSGSDPHASGVQSAGRTPSAGLRKSHAPGSPGGRLSGGFDLGRPSLVSPRQTMFSSVHTGMCIFLARELHNIWNQSICSCQDPNGYQQLAISPRDLKLKQEKLSLFVSFLEQYDPDAYLPFDEDDLISSKDARDHARSNSAHRSIRDDIHQHHSYLDIGSHGQGSAQANLATGTYAASLGRQSVDRGQARQQQMHTRKSSDMRRAEVGAIQNLKQLCLRSIEALAFLSILSEHQLHRIVPAVDFDVRETFVKMEVCDLVAREPGANISAALIEVLFRGYSAVGNDVSMLSKILQSRCGSYFDDDDMTLQGGYQRIRAANHLLGTVPVMNGAESSSGTTSSTSSELPWDPALLQNVAYVDRVEAQRLVAEAVLVLKPLSGRIFNLESLCSQISWTGSLPLAIDLALFVGKDAENRRDNESASKAYDCVLGLIEPLLLFDASKNTPRESRSHDLGSAHRSELSSGRHGEERRFPPEHGRSKAFLFEFEEIKDATMRVALQSNSEKFRVLLYSLLTKSKQGERELLSRPLASVDQFLRDSGNRDLMWRYYSQHGRYADAAGVLLLMAEDDSMACTLADRFGYLTRALHNAKTAVSSGDMQAPALETDIKDVMDVVRVQIRLSEELAREHRSDMDADTALAELNEKIFDLTVLYNEYAVPFDLLQSTLDILRCGSCRDDEQLHEIWVKIVSREIESSQVPSLVRQRIVSLGREYYPDDVAFPTGFLIDLLERQLFERRHDIAWSSIPKDWVCEMMTAIGVPFSDVVDAYRGMIESTGSKVGTPARLWSWVDERDQLHLIACAEAVCSHGLAKITNKTDGHELDRRAIIGDVERIRRVVALCKSRLRAMSSSTVQALTQKFSAVETALIAVT